MNRPHCMDPSACPAKPGRHCLRCHARRVALQNHKRGVVQTPEVKAKRVASYRKTRVGFIPEGMEDLNRKLRNSHYGVEERKRIFGQQQVVEVQREMRRKHEREKAQRY